MSKLYMPRSVTDTICLSPVFCDGDSVVVFDGGFASEGEVLAAELKSDYVQMAYHGQNGAKKTLYEIIDPDYCLGCTPQLAVGQHGQKRLRHQPPQNRHHPRLDERAWHQAALRR